MSNIIRINEFPIDKMKFSRKSVIIGKPGSGKSTLISNIIKQHRHLAPVAKVFNGNEENNHFYEKMFPPLFIFSEYSSQEMIKLAKRQQIMKAKYKDADPEFPERCPMVNAMLIIDDCSDNPKLMKEPIFQKFMKMGRHWCLMQILCLQAGMDIQKNIKNCLNYVFIFNHPTKNEKESIYRNYVPSMFTLKEFEDIMEQVCEKYTALVIDLEATEKNNCMFYYKTKIDTSFDVGCSEYKQWSDARYDANYIDKIISDMTK